MKKRLLAFPLVVCLSITGLAQGGGEIPIGGSSPRPCPPGQTCLQSAAVDTSMFDLVVYLRSLIGV